MVRPISGNSGNSTWRSLSSTSSMKAARGRSDPTGRATGCSRLIACVVFSGTEAVPEETKHGGDITETGGEGDSRGVTRLDTEAGTVQDVGDETPRGPNGELIGHEDMAPT